METAIKRSLLIFGASTAGKNALANLSKTDNVLAYVDNDPAKQGSMFEGRPVISPSALNDFEYDRIVIASEFFESISEQLITAFNIAPEKIEVLSQNQLAPMCFGHSAAMKDTAETLIFTLAELFDSRNIDYFIDAGTLLGIYRDQALIPWDSDLDFGVMENEVDAVALCLTQSLPTLNARTGGQWQCTPHLAQQSFGAIQCGDIRAFKLNNIEGPGPAPQIDIFVKYVRGAHVDYSLASRGISVPREHVDRFDAICYQEKTLKVPHDPEGYLAAYYGDWRTPVKQWHVGNIKGGKRF